MQELREPPLKVRPSAVRALRFWLNFVTALDARLVNRALQVGKLLGWC